MLSKLILAAAAVTLLAAGEASAAEYEMVNHADIVFAEHDGTKLVGDLYLPKGRSKAPVLVAVHGGGWQVGNKQFYRNWGLFLARAGYAVFAVDYRLGKPGVYPAAVYDVKAAVQFIRAKAGDYDLDPERIGLIGDFRRRASRFAGGARRRPVQRSVPRRRQRCRSDECQMRHRFLRRL